MQNFQAHSDRTRENDVGRNAVCEGQCQEPGKSTVSIFKDDEYNYPNAENAKAEDKQALEETG